MKVALITGAARRVGAEIAVTLHATGFNVILHYHRSKKEAETLLHQLNELRPNSAYALSADLTKLDQVRALVPKAASVWGQLDVLINNASRFYTTSINTASEDQWADLMDSNLRAPFFLCQTAIKYLTETNGCMINLADVHAARPMHDYSIYCISKAGIVMLTQALAKELGPTIRVNAISPGIVALPEGENHLSAETEAALLKKIPLKRHGSPKDIAKAVLFLIKDGSFITGQVITVDGGRTLSM